MANEIPQIQDAQPVLSAVNVNSGAEGYEAFAKTLGALSQEAASTTEEMVKEQSQSMYINSVANAEQLKTQAQIQMLEHPDQAPKIAKDTDYTLETIKQSAFVNTKDRTKLNAYLSGVSDDVALKATTTEVKQRQLEAAFTHYANWPDQLKAYQQALLTDHDKAEQLKTAMITSLHSLVSTGAITPEQAGSGIKTMQEVVGIANDHYAMYGNPNATAKDYHTLTSNPLNQGQDNSGAPINANTGWMIDYYNNDKSFQGVQADIFRRTLPNPMAFDSLTANERQHAILNMQGVQVADGMINSGEPFPVIEKTLSSLKESGRVLNYREQGLKAALDNYVSELKNGNYLSVMSQTPAGNKIMQGFVTGDTAIRNSPIDADKKNQMLMQNKNNMIDQAISYADAHHIPREYVQPIPQADIAITQKSFELGQDPSNVLSVLGQYDKTKQAYVANAMKNSDQRMVVAGVSLANTGISYQDKIDFIAANQTGRNYLGKNIEGTVADKTLQTRIYTNLSDAIRTVGQNYDYEQSQKLQTSMIDNTMRYAKYLAAKDNNATMENKGFNLFMVSDPTWMKYVDQASKIYKEGYKQQSSTNWTVNPNQLPQPLSNKQLDVLADYAIRNGNDYLKTHLGEQRYNQMAGRGSLKMIITPTNDVQAVNANGDVAFSVPYSNDLLSHAAAELNKRKAEDLAIQRKATLEAIERREKAMLNVRLPEDANTQ